MYGIRRKSALSEVKHDDDAYRVLVKGFLHIVLLRFRSSSTTLKANYIKCKKMSIGAIYQCCVKKILFCDMFRHNEHTCVVKSALAQPTRLQKRFTVPSAAAFV